MENDDLLEKKVDYYQRVISEWFLWNARLWAHYKEISPYGDCKEQIKLIEKSMDKMKALLKKSND